MSCGGRVVELLAPSKGPAGALCLAAVLCWTGGRTAAEERDAPAAVVARAESLARVLDGVDAAAADRVLAAELAPEDRSPYGRAFGALVAKLYREPHAHRSARFAAAQRLDRETIYRLYEMVRGSPLVTTLLRQFSPHPHFIQILGRELEDTDWLEQLVTEGYAPPKKLELHIGHRCPADCAFCFSAELRGALARSRQTIPVRVPFYPDELQGDRPMSLAEYTALIDEFRALSPVAHPILVLSGGAEPLTFKPLPELIAYAAERGIRAQLYTSGIAMSRSDGAAFYDRLLQADFIRLSLNAATAETYRREMRVDAFDRVVENTRRLVARKRERGAATELRANFVAGPENVDELGRFADLAQELGLDRISVRLPYVQTTGSLSERDRERVEGAVQGLRDRIKEQRYPQLIVDLPERWILDEMTPAALGIEGFDRSVALFSPTVTPYRHVVHRCTSANPGYFKPELALGTLELAPATPAAARRGLGTILERFVRGETSWHDDPTRYDTNALATELILRLARDELRAGFRLERWPLGPAATAPRAALDRRGAADRSGTRTRAGVTARPR
ncbi:MAG: radical SAM protein [Proteobacteria bacterium]|nr:radical SAM protein [Pseudomonadota bacterium]